jgi:hypothetical protein
MTFELLEITAAMLPSAVISKGSKPTYLAATKRTKAARRFPEAVGFVMAGRMCQSQFSLHFD